MNLTPKALTKSNKFMKRATYYREKARLGEFINDNGSNKKSSNNSNNASNKTSRARYAGRDSSESNCSSMSRSEQLNSRASSAGDEAPITELKENLMAVKEMDNEEESNKGPVLPIQDVPVPMESDVIANTIEKEVEPEMDKSLHTSELERDVPHELGPRATNSYTASKSFFLEVQEFPPENWSVEDVAKHLEWYCLGRFKPQMISEVSFVSLMRKRISL